MGARYSGRRAAVAANTCWIYFCGQSDAIGRGVTMTDEDVDAMIASKKETLACPNGMVHAKEGRTEFAVFALG